MGNRDNAAAQKWPAGDFTSALKRAVSLKCQAGNANMTCMWIFEQCTDLTTKSLAVRCQTGIAFTIYGKMSDGLL